MAEGVRQMTPDKILEIARRDLQVIFAHYIPEDIISFAQAIIEAEGDAHGITVPIAVWDKLKGVNTVTDLIKALKADG
jgi:hypothetical protein